MANRGKNEEETIESGIKKGTQNIKEKKTRERKETKDNNYKKGKETRDKTKDCR